jgi:hypothetical protein
MMRIFGVLAAVCLTAGLSADDYSANYVAATLVRLNDNGAWSWFMDPRVIVNDGKLITPETSTTAPTSTTTASGTRRSSPQSFRRGTDREPA